MTGPMINLIAVISKGEDGYTIAVMLGGIIMWTGTAGTKIGAQLIAAKRIEEIAMQTPTNN